MIGASCLSVNNGVTRYDESGMELRSVGWTSVIRELSKVFIVSPSVILTPGERARGKQIKFSILLHKSWL